MFVKNSDINGLKESFKHEFEKRDMLRDQDLEKHHSLLESQIHLNETVKLHMEEENKRWLKIIVALVVLAAIDITSNPWILKFVLGIVF